MEMRCFGASGQLGYGIPREAYFRGLEQKPAFVGCDMGSVDPGPYYLGSGTAAAGEISRRADLELVLTTARQANIPLTIGSAGTAGGEPHLAETVRLIEEIAAQHDLHFGMAVIHAEVEQDYVLRKLAAGQVRPCGTVRDLTSDDVRSTIRMVGQMGNEPMMSALRAGADVVVAGRACDTSIFAALPLLHGFDPGLAMHQAKLIECASMCAEPGGRDAIIATIHDDHFTVESMNPARRCTPRSVAAHSLYEQPDPNRILEPGGQMELSKCSYVAVNERVTRVSGSRWLPSSEYTIKLEGVASRGFRAISMGGSCDPTFIATLGTSTAEVAKIVDRLFPDEAASRAFSLRFRNYGTGEVLGSLAVDREWDPKEVFVVIDVVADSAQLASSVCGVAKQYFLHYFYEGILATGGNIAIPFGPEVIPVGEVFHFNVYHLVTVDDPMELFPIEYRSL